MNGGLNAEMTSWEPIRPKDCHGDREWRTASILHPGCFSRYDMGRSAGVMILAGDGLSSHMAFQITKLMPTQSNAEASHAPLHSKDRVTQTVGCRHTQPAVCTKNSMPNVCVFVRQDGMCLSPPKSWAKHFKKLKQKRAKR